MGEVDGGWEWVSNLLLGLALLWLVAGGGVCIYSARSFRGEGVSVHVVTVIAEEFGWTVIGGALLLFCGVALDLLGREGSRGG